MTQLIVDLVDREDCLSAQRLLEDHVKTLERDASVEQLVADGVARLGDQGRALLGGMVRSFEPGQDFTLRELSQHIGTPYEEIRQIMYRSVGRVFSDDVLKKRRSAGGENIYRIEAAVHAALVDQL